MPRYRTMPHAVRCELTNLKKCVGYGALVRWHPFVLHTFMPAASIQCEAREGASLLTGDRIILRLHCLRPLVQLSR